MKNLTDEQLEQIKEALKDYEATLTPEELAELTDDNS
jgi:hypothetical protein